MSDDRAEFLAERIAAARERAGATTPAVRALAPRALLPRIVAAAELERVPFKGYCGVFRNGQRYSAGDAVTHSGSTWLAMRDTLPEDKPGTCDAWRLWVRKGADGEAGPPGTDATLVDARATFERDPTTHRTTKVKLHALDTGELLATMKPQNDAEGFLESCTIRWATAA